jgi:hypothetical protein
MVTNDGNHGQPKEFFKQEPSPHLLEDEESQLECSQEDDQLQQIGHNTKIWCDLIP